MNECFVKDYTDNGECSSCGRCCANALPLSEHEVRRIKIYIKEKGIKEQRHNAMVGVDMTCPFRDEANHKCLIYDIRPEICRKFMCNHDIDDIKKWKVDFHKKFKVVFMRNEFFGNEEDITLFKNYIAIAMVGGLNG